MFTLNQKKEYIEQKIKEANPELMKLEFGCILKREDELGDKYYKYVKRDSDFPPNLDDVQVIDKYENLLWLAKKSFEIIGKEIQLHHVLLAIESMNDMKFDAGKFFFNHGDTNLWFSSGDGQEITGKLRWNMMKPNLEDQLEDVWDSLYRIMNR